MSGAPGCVSAATQVAVAGTRPGTSTESRDSPKTADSTGERNELGEPLNSCES